MDSTKLSILIDVVYECLIGVSFSSIDFVCLAIDCEPILLGILELTPNIAAKTPNSSVETKESDRSSIKMKHTTHKSSCTHEHIQWKTKSVAYQLKCGDN